MDPLQQTLSLSDRLPVETTPATTELALYTRFSRRQKQFILAMVTWAGLFSPLTANIYFPALAELAADMGVSESRIDLTVTTYMVFQGISPTLFGGLADAAGRRPAFMVGFAVYLAANIGLALQSSYVGLAVLRCVQSMGCSGAIALGMGVLADISTNAERGMYVGFFQSGAMMGPSLGPLVGGLLVSWKGWRSIFFFLIVFCAIFLVPFLAFFPETGRSVVGDGSIRPWGWNRSLWNYYCDSRAAKQVQSTQSPLGAAAATTPPVNAKRFNWPNPLRALYMLGEKGVGLVLVYNAIIYTAFYDVATSTSALFGEIYGYNSLQIGLCFMYAPLTFSFPSLSLWWTNERNKS
jgi:multidrug resistance protein